MTISFKSRQRGPVKAPLPTIEELLENAIPEPNTGCWLWLGCVERNGYGVFRRRPHGKFYVHRYVCDTPDGMDTLHSCDVRSCINPEHLRPGTRQDNMDDMVKKGRQKRAGAKAKTHSLEDQAGGSAAAVGARPEDRAA